MTNVLIGSLPILMAIGIILLFAGMPFVPFVA